MAASLYVELAEALRWLGLVVDDMTHCYSRETRLDQHEGFKIKSSRLDSYNNGSELVVYESNDQSTNNRELLKKCLRASWSRAQCAPP